MSLSPPEAVPPGEVDFLRAVLDCAPVGITVLGLDGGVDPEALAVAYVNPTLRRRVGIGVEERVEGRRLLELLPGLRGVDALRRCVEVADGGAACDLGDITYGERHGAPAVFKGAAQPLPGRRVALFLRDITRQRQAEEELRRTRGFWESVLEHMPALLLIKDAEDLRIRTASRAWQRELGIAPVDLVGKAERELLPEVQAALLDERDRQTLAAEGSVLISEERIATSMGPRTLRTRRAAVRDEAGRATHVLLIAEDITERLAVDEQLRAANAALEQQAAAARAELDTKERLLGELDQQLDVIARQQEQILRLSAPVIELRDGVLVVPIVGGLSAARSEDITGRLLAAVADKRARCVILDLTGADAVDTGDIDNLLRISRAVGLMGARGMITGVRPHLAQAMVGLGVDFGGIAMRRTLREALEGLMGPARGQDAER